MWLTFLPGFFFFFLDIEKIFLLFTEILYKVKSVIVTFWPCLYWSISDNEEEEEEEDYKKIFFYTHLILTIMQK